MAPIPGAGGARYAPRGVMRALLRVVLLSGLVAVAWLLGSGISHADEDLGQPGNGLIHIVNVVSASNTVSTSNTVSSEDDGSAEEVGTPAAIAPIVKKVLPAAAAPRLPVQPPAQLNILRPVVSAVGVAKPLSQVLPVSRPLPLLDQQAGPAQHTDALLAPTPAGKPATLPAAAPNIAEKSATAAPEVTALGHTPAAVPCSAAQTSPAQLPADPSTIQPVLGNAPLSPMPANPPGNTTSPCTVGGSAGGAGSKNGSDFAVHDSGMTGGFTQPHGPLDRDASEFPLVLALQPSTSPD